MPRPTGATGAVAAGAVALDASVGFGRASGAPPLPRPFPMVGVVATGGGAAALTAEKKAGFWDSLFFDGKLAETSHRGDHSNEGAQKSTIGESMEYLFDLHHCNPSVRKPPRSLI